MSRLEMLRAEAAEKVKAIDNEYLLEQVLKIIKPENNQYDSLKTEALKTHKKGMMQGLFPKSEL